HPGSARRIPRCSFAHSGRPALQHAMRCCIVGAGATGGHLAVKLHKAGHDVAVLARGAQLEAIRRSGLTLEQDPEVLQATVRASDNARELGPQDLVFVATKATALAGVAGHLPPLLTSQTSVAFLQNGMTWWYPVKLPPDRPAPPPLPMFALANIFLSMMRPEQILGGVVYSANEVLRPAVVRNNSPHKNMIELATIEDTLTDDLALARSTLEEAGIASPVPPDVRTAMWLKLVGNASASSLCVATGQPAALIENPDVKAVYVRLLIECLAIAHAHGYPVADRFDISAFTRHRGQHKPSMLQDYEAGRIMEIREMVLAPVAFARAVDLATPTLDAVAAIATQLARARGLVPQDELPS
ncbi:MAG: hypothetical protein JWQ72_941, partial [Polaromonas sp.]|nr:hypothetical protein [Polaromonas sp.]